MINVVIPPGKSGQVLVAIAIGDACYAEFSQFSLPSWKAYCKKYELGLLVFTEHLIEESHPDWKKPTWQKLLIGVRLSQELPEVTRVCYLDTDILISPLAPNVFEDHDSSRVGLVSLRKSLPYPYHEVLRRIAFLRHHHYSRDYPLDSALFISVEDLYAYHGLAVQEDEACAGMFVFTVDEHASYMESCFHQYDKSIDSITGGGDQTHFNYEIQRSGLVQWMDYSFQAIWVFEMAWKFPFLYSYGKNKPELIKECILASLHSNCFLHFAGSWHESQMWKTDGLLSDETVKLRFKSFSDYREQPVTGKPQGMVKPS